MFDEGERWRDEGRMMKGEGWINMEIRLLEGEVKVV
jgi:hypothetical protein